MAKLRHKLIRYLPPSWRHALRAWNSVRQVRRFRPEDWPEARLVQRLIRPGDVVVDAGANIGYISALLARWVGPQGLVHSIEPIPATFDLLQRDMVALGLSQVRCHACGVSDQAGQAVMEIPEYPDGGANYYESKVVAVADRASPAQQTVRLRTLDEVVGDTLDRVTFMKIDVEGHEEPALRGAGRLLDRARPAMLIEINGSLDEPDEKTARLLADLTARGYGIYLPGGATGLQQREAGQRAVDYYFLTPEHLANRWTGASPRKDPSR